MIDQELGIVTGYHLFLEPTGLLKEQLEQHIRVLAEALTAPQFPPHVTLLGGIPEGDATAVLQKAELLAAKLQPITIRLEDVGMEDKFFRSLYLLAEKTPELVNAHKTALEVFAQTSTDEYKPHLSLLYGKFDEDCKKKNLSKLPLNMPIEFLSGALYVYKADGPASAWELLEAIPLSAHS